DRARGRDVDIVGDQWTLLRRSDTREGRQQDRQQSEAFHEGKRSRDRNHLSKQILIQRELIHRRQSVYQKIPSFGLSMEIWQNIFTVGHRSAGVFGMESQNLKKEAGDQGGLRLVSDSKGVIEAPEVEKQFVNFMFFRVNPEWR